MGGDKKTNIVIFTGIMNAEGYEQILRQALLPFIHTIYPQGHCLMQDNDVQEDTRFFEEEGNWWRAPAESPDCNPIECLWHELKEFIRREIKPSCQGDLI